MKGLLKLREVAARVTKVNRKQGRAEKAAEWLSHIKDLKRAQKVLVDVAEILDGGVLWNRDAGTERRALAAAVAQLVTLDGPTCSDLSLASYFILERNDAAATGLLFSIASEQFPRFIRDARAARSCYLPKKGKA